MSDTLVIDWAQLLELRELQEPGEPDVVADLIRTFVEDSAVRMGRLREAAAAGSARQVRLEAHAIKGSSSLMGAGRLTELAQVVESAAEAEGVSPLMIERLGRLVEDARRLLIQGPPR